MKSKLVLAIATAIAFAFSAGTASAGMSGQGTHPDAKKPEYKEKNPGDTTGKKEASRTGAKQTGAAVEETATTPATKKSTGGEKGTDKMK